MSYFATIGFTLSPVRNLRDRSRNQTALSRLLCRARPPRRAQFLAGARQRSDPAVRQRRHEPVQGHVPRPGETRLLARHQHARNACAPAASTTTSKTSATPAAITLFSRCSATFPSAIISRPRLSNSPGTWSPRNSRCPKTSFTSPYSARMTRPKTSGRRLPACPRIVSSASTKRIISGRWAKPAPAGPAPKSTTTSDRRPPTRASRTSTSPAMPATVTSKSGTSCSCSTIGTRAAGSPRCRAPRSTPAWASSAPPPCSRARSPITKPI